MVDAHADAVAITAELAGRPIGSGQRWGVWAAGPADSLHAWSDRHGWRMEGAKAWCSGASRVTHVLVDASTACIAVARPLLDRSRRRPEAHLLAHDAGHAALVADLTVYVRQHHGERDLELMGRRLSQLDDPWSGRARRRRPSTAPAPPSRTGRTARTSASFGPGPDPHRQHDAS